MKNFALILMSLLMMCCTKDDEVKAATQQEAGKIDGLSESQLRTFLKAGESNVSVTLSLSNTTGINGLTPNPIPEQSSPTRSLSPKGEGSIYTLSGQRMAQVPARGIYIENGNKRIAR